MAAFLTGLPGEKGTRVNYLYKNVTLIKAFEARELRYLFHGIKNILV
jgi:hypothetical protein